MKIKAILSNNDISGDNNCRNFDRKTANIDYRITALYLNSNLNAV